jgi:phytol kinase
MFTLFWVIVAGLLVLVFSELVRRRLRISNEDSRKTYHVVHALIISAAPFLVSYHIIILLELVLLLNMFWVRRLKLFSWLYNVGRLSWGEYFGIAGVVLIAWLHPNKWVFLAAMLHLGIADAAAALIGKRYGKGYQFKVFGQIKSIPGSLAFLIASIIITVVVIVWSQSGASYMMLLLLPPLATLAETASPFGTDNFVIPVLVVLVLNTLRVIS